MSIGFYALLAAVKRVTKSERHGIKEFSSLLSKMQAGKFDRS